MPSDRDPTPAIALVVCTRDRARHLAACLDAIAALRAHVPWEAVLVDNGSRDATPAMLEEFARAAPVRVRLAHEPLPGLARARNAGVAATTAPLLAFTDDDCYPAPDLLDRWVEVFDDPAVGFAAGRILLHDPADHPITISYEEAPRALRPGAFVEPGLLQGANMAFRREVLAVIGGFDPRLGPGGAFNFEDLDVASRASAAGFGGGFFPGPTVRHHHRRRAAEELRALRASYDHGRGAYFASLLLRGSTRALGARAWLSSLRRKTRSEIAGEIRGARDYIRSRSAGRPAGG